MRMTTFEVIDHIAREPFLFGVVLLVNTCCMYDCNMKETCIHVYTKSYILCMNLETCIGCSFATHYEGNREPYIVVLDPVWVKTDYKLEGTIQFVDYLRAAFNVSS